MSIVAWDGRAIAADKRAVLSDATMTTTKLWRLDSGVVLGTTGDAGFGVAMVEWFKAGEQKDQWPDFQRSDNWARLIVVEPGCNPYSYEREPFRQLVEDDYMAWGSGRDFALGALANGATAIDAVKIASLFNIYCGNGFDAFDLT